MWPWLNGALRVGWKFIPEVSFDVHQRVKVATQFLSFCIPLCCTECTVMFRRLVSFLLCVMLLVYNKLGFESHIAVGLKNSVLVMAYSRLSEI